MLRVFVLLVALSGASAFRPFMQNMRSKLLRLRSQIMKMAFEDEIGALSPTGFWDPLGLSKGIDKNTFEQRRAAELKHGRVAMLAVVGLVIQEYARLPGSIDLDGSSFEAVPNGINAIAAVPAVGWAQIIAAIAYFELFGWRQREGSTPGDFGFGSKVFGEEINGTEKEVDLKTKEIQHGRLAMLGVSDLIVNDLLRPAVGETISVIQHF